jgi:hypothetical protein
MKEEAMRIKRGAWGIAAGVVAVGALAVPAVAGAGPFGPGSPGPGTGMGPGYGAGMGYGGRMGAAGQPGFAGQGQPGACPMIDSAEQGTLTDAQKATVQAMAEEEKLAGDLYQAFADRYPTAIFDRIGAAEDQHLAAVRTVLERYGLSDPTAGKAAGQFATASVQATYDRLLAQGSASQTAALSVGAQVEQTDIADLQRAATGLDAPDVALVYQHLLAASRQHLAAFTAWPAR